MFYLTTPIVTTHKVNTTYTAQTSFTTTNHTAMAWHYHVCLPLLLTDGIGDGGSMVTLASTPKVMLYKASVTQQTSSQHNWYKETVHTADTIIMYLQLTRVITTIWPSNFLPLYINTSTRFSLSDW